MMPSAFEQFCDKGLKAESLPGDFFTKKLVIEQRCPCGAYRILTESNG